MSNIAFLSGSKFRIYYAPDDEGVVDHKDVPILTIDPNYETDLINYNYHFYEERIEKSVRVSGRQPIAYRYVSGENYILKLVRPPHIERVELLSSSDEVLTSEIFYEIDPITKVKEYFPNYYYWVTVRYNYYVEDDTTTTETSIHEFTLDSHYSRMKYGFNECNDNSIIRKEFIQGLFSNTIAEVVNSNLLTKNYQIFHLGSLINDRYDMEN